MVFFGRKHTSSSWRKWTGGLLLILLVAGFVPTALIAKGGCSEKDHHLASDGSPSRPTHKPESPAGKTKQESQTMTMPCHQGMMATGNQNPPDARTPGTAKTPDCCDQTRDGICACDSQGQPLNQLPRQGQLLRDWLDVLHRQVWRPVVLGDWNPVQKMTLPPMAGSLGQYWLRQANRSHASPPGSVLSLSSTGSIGSALPRSLQSFLI